MTGNSKMVAGRPVAHQFYPFFFRGRDKFFAWGIAMKLLRIALGMAVGGWAALLTAEEPSVVLYKSPTCGCCTGYAAYLRDHGFKVEEQPVADVEAIKNRLHVPANLRSCHTAVIGDYVVEGHVPVDVVRRLLAEHPPITGIASPGMPSGSPGMPGPKEPNRIQAFSPTGTSLYAEE